MAIALLFNVEFDGKEQYIVWFLEQAFPLQWTDRVTGDTLKVLMEDHLNFHGFGDCRALCPYMFDNSTGDKAAAHDRMDNGFTKSPARACRD